MALSEERIPGYVNGVYDHLGAAVGRGDRPAAQEIIDRVRTTDQLPDLADIMDAAVRETSLYTDPTRE